ncbi:MAG: META domain-containing protein [Hydrogenophaga sp.]|jgi:heat shock protein HslJ|uniref:META domain-containing protein n=1 Tax=Hydrogenophaga sp. TaxID=1904254 RepID=UPI002A361934|nr:META domain-containing protein [Hydrogenophaga sp.]MDX9969981.1 META domain-containing protein [Hydrogenophaga sp.]
MHRSPRQPTRRTAAALCLGTLALAVTACTTQAAGTSPSTPNLTGTEWRLTALGSDAALPQPQATLAFPDAGRAAGHTSCNRFFGSVNVQGTTIRFSQLGATRMACIGPADGQERRVLKSLASAHRFELSGDTLVIHAPGADTLRYTRTK